MALPNNFGDFKVFTVPCDVEGLLAKAVSGRRGSIITQEGLRLRTTLLR
jgi:hypothetical protein